MPDVGTEIPRQTEERPEYTSWSSSLARRIRSVAGISEDILKDCPTSDKIWATQLGLMLTLTFIVVFGIAYFSISYVLQSAGLEGREIGNAGGEEGIGLQLLAILIAFVVAGVVFLFDRAIYQSDWFYQMPLEARWWFWRKCGHYISKTWRVIIRVLISIAVAYTLSTLLELRIHESYILTEMQKEHVQQNKRIYDEIKAYEDTLNNEVNVQRENYNRLLQLRLEAAGVVQIDEDVSKRRDDIDEKIRKMEEEFQAQLRNITTDEEVRLRDLVESQTALEQSRETVMRNENEANRMFLAEKLGNPEGIPGVSNIPVCGRRCRYWEGIYIEKMEERERLDRQLEQVKGQIAAIRRSATEDRKAIRTGYTDRREALMRERAEITGAIHGKDEPDRDDNEKQREILNADIQAAKGRLDSLEEERGPKLEKFREEMLASASFIRMRDGPIDRLRALEALMQDPINGETVKWFSWWIKGFVIFLEVVPVLAKMFFSPPSLYAVRLKEQVLETDMDLEEQIERRRIKLSELRRSRVGTEFMTENYEENVRSIHSEERQRR